MCCSSGQHDGVGGGKTTVDGGENCPGEQSLGLFSFALGVDLEPRENHRGTDRSMLQGRVSSL